MIFENAYITNAGHSLLTRATAGTKIIWGKCGCYSQNINSMSQSAINALTSLTGPVGLGTASAVFELETGENGTAKITCQVDNTSEEVTPGYAHSFGLWAKIDGDENEVLVVVARVGSHQATYFPEYTDATDRLIGIVDLSVVVQSGVASTISITPSSYALSSNLQTEIDHREALEERTVTTHSADDEEEGDLQVILGHKAFVDGVSIGDNESSSHGNMKMYETGMEIRYITDGYVSSCIELKEGGIVIDTPNASPGNEGVKIKDKLHMSGDIIPETSDLSIGSSTSRWDNIYCDYMNVNSIESSTIIANTRMEADQIEVGTIKAYEMNTEITVNAAALIPSSTNEIELGSSDKRWNIIYSKDIDATLIQSAYIEANSIETNSCEISGNMTCEGGVTAASCEISGNMTCEGGVTAASFNGLVPNPTKNQTALNIPVGAIVCAKLTGYTNRYQVGEVITLPDQAIQTCDLEGTTFTEEQYIPGGTYRFLSRNAVNSAVLLIRIA